MASTKFKKGQFKVAFQITTLIKIKVCNRFNQGNSSVIGNVVSFPDGIVQTWAFYGPWAISHPLAISVQPAAIVAVVAMAVAAVVSQWWLWQWPWWWL